ncbi:MAG: TolC family protein [Kiritimatiellia bacterium]
MKTLFSLLLFPTLLLAQTEFLSLEDAWQIALRENPSEEIAQARLDQAEARYRQSQSRYHPLIGATASGSRIDYSDSSLQRLPPGTSDSTEIYDAGLQANWLLWDSGIRKNSMEAARFQRDATEAARLDSREQLLAQVGNAFTAAQLARANLRIAEADVEFQNRQLENSIRKEKAGLDSRTDRLNFEIRKLGAENTAIQQQANYESAMAALGALLGQPADQPLPPPVKLEPGSQNLPGEISDVNALWQTARENLPALNQAALLVEAARSNLQASKGEYGPEISLFGNLSAEREEDPSFGSEDVGNTVGVQISWDIWTGNARKQQVLEADALLRENQAAARQVQLRAIADIQQAHSEYLASVTAEKISEQTFELSKENRDLVEASYQAGRETLLRLNEAQRDFNNAGSRYVASRLQRQLAWIRLQQSTGTLRQQVNPAE